MRTDARGVPRVVALGALLLAISCAGGDPPGGRVETGGARADAAAAEEVASPPDSAAYERFVRGVVREMNLARMRPAEYAAHVRLLEGRFEERLLRRPGRLPVETKEGVAPVREAAAYLDTVRSANPLYWSQGMADGAADHVREQSASGTIGHSGSGGSMPWDRIGRYGEWEVYAGENIWYGTGTPRDVVVALIVDDGVPDRGHRHALFQREYRYTGVAWGAHPVYDSMCVITYARGYTERLH